MPTFLRLAREVVALDWRLLVAECRAHAQDLLLFAAIGALVLAGLCTSAWTAAGLLASRPPALVSIAAAGYAWAVWGAAAALALGAGAHATTQRIASHLGMLPATRLQVFLLVQVIGLCGRYACMAGVVSLPVLVLFAGLLGGPRLVAAVAALVLMLRLMPGLIRIVLFAGGVLRPRTLIAISGGALGLLLAVTSLPSASTLAAALPPTAVARLISGQGSAAVPWLMLLLWTAAVGLLEFKVLSSNGLRRETRRPGASPRLPAWIVRAADACSLSPPLLHGELLRLVRWPRFVAANVTAVAIAAVMLAAGTPARPGVLPLLVPVLLCLLMLTAVMSNLFAPDRAGAQSFFLHLDRPQSILRAKVTAVAILALVPASVVAGFLVLFAPAGLQRAHLYVPLGAAALFLWAAATGRIVSVLFPSPSDPRVLGAGSLLKGAAAILAVTSNMAFAAGVAGAAFLYDTARLGTIGLFVIGGILAALALAAGRVTTRAAERVLLAQRERLIEALGAGTALS